MKTRQQPHSRRGLAGTAFTVVELLVAVSVMTVIVLTLYTVFDQTQRAMRSNSTQVDVLEGARAASEMLGRELAQMDASHVSTNLNFFATRSQYPSFQAMPGTNELRLNDVQEFFFLNRNNKEWQLLGYLIRPEYAQSPLGGAWFQLPFGTLYRGSLSCPAFEPLYENVTVPYLNERSLFSVRPGQPDYIERSPFFQPVIDGVVHFKIQPFDALGRPMSFASTNLYGTNLVNYGYDVLMNPDPLDGAVGPATEYRFLNNEVPAYVELEIGVVEPQVMDQIRTMPTQDRAQEFFFEQAGRTHLFHQRIPIRTAE